MDPVDLVVVHGGAITAKYYEPLARRLAGRVTVHLYNRRGRADAGPRAPGYTVDDEIADLAAVLERTGARNVLGHSYGGLVVLRAALELPLDNIVLYDGAVNVDGTFPTDFIPRMRAYIDAGDVPRALAVMSGGLKLNGLSFGVRVAVTKLFLKTPVGRMMGELLPGTMLETEEVAATAGPATEYAGITARALLAAGGRSGAYYREMNEKLAAAMPDARTAVVRGASHNEPCLGRPRFADLVADFLARAPEEARAQ
ncbi:alpha/beta fold hydrolase [Dactylosporangium sp. CS-047395]|uniref:alpha/beta fold hydrolase n=1 Tax=Dactylosporangium sp. CS-047395 TaxID=3239936 RepID=UPI003D8A5975